MWFDKIFDAFFCNINKTANCDDITVYLRMLQQKETWTFQRSIVLIGAFRADKSSHRRWSVRKCVRRNFAKFTGKHLYQSLFFNKVTGLRVTASKPSQTSKMDILAKIINDWKHLYNWYFTTSVNILCNIFAKIPLKMQLLRVAVICDLLINMRPLLIKISHCLIQHFFPSEFWLLSRKVLL